MDATKTANKAYENGYETAESVRKYLDESATAGQTYIAAVSAALQAGLRTQYELQSAAFQTTRSLADSLTQAVTQANPLHKSKPATAMLPLPSASLCRNTTPRPKAVSTI